MKSIRSIALLVCAGLSFAACAETSAGGADIETETGEPFEESPPPTIGLGSDLGAISGSTEIRAIDTGSIDTVVMIGDSITVGAMSLLQERFDFLGFEEVSITAETGKRIGVSFGDNPSGADLATFIAAGQEGDPAHTAWVVALGTNDVGQYDGPEQVVEEIDRVLEPIPDEAPVIWVDTYFADRLDGTEDVNSAIEQRLRERGNATIGRWSAIAPTDGVLSGDGVHASNDGNVVFADLVVTTLVDFLQ